MLIPGWLSEKRHARGAGVLCIKQMHHANEGERVKEGGWGRLGGTWAKEREDICGEENISSTKIPEISYTPWWHPFIYYRMRGLARNPFVYIPLLQRVITRVGGYKYDSVGRTNYGRWSRIKCLPLNRPWTRVNARYVNFRQRSVSGHEFGLIAL